MNKFNEIAFPFITCYARIIDRTTMLPLTGFQDALDKTKIWNLGEIYYEGGISQYAIEFDIWNNEPVVSNGFTKMLYDNANNCNVSIWKDNTKTNCHNELYENVNFEICDSTFGVNTNFSSYYEDNNFIISGNENPNLIGILQGTSDHTKFILNIKMNKNRRVNRSIPFVVCFQYTSQEQTVNLFFKCKFDIKLNYIDPIINKIENDYSIFNGNINNEKSYYHRGLDKISVSAYQNNILKDRFETTNKYYLFLKSGLYDIKIKNNLKERVFHNVSVDTNLQDNCSYVSDGYIKDIYNDVIEYYGNIKEITGIIYDEYGNITKDTEILFIKDNDIVVYISNSRYKFILEEGTYNIRIRNELNNVKIINDFNFIDGFSNYLIDMPMFNNNLNSKKV